MKVLNEVLPAAVGNQYTGHMFQSTVVSRGLRSPSTRPVYTYIHVHAYIHVSRFRLTNCSLYVALYLQQRSVSRGDTILMNRPRARNHRARNSPRCVARAHAAFPCVPAERNDISVG